MTDARPSDSGHPDPDRNLEAVAARGGAWNGASDSSASGDSVGDAVASEIAVWGFISTLGVLSGTLAGGIENRMALRHLGIFRDRP
ncbi:hypothetical protein GRX01_04245 [Halobaculum sp. WSA2]|uniref:Uncharacterized protein n=1 Tax=Halobaculum saliterrae TaxID=2073113 RepID=A0A6B0SNR2_9EURY|nr:hypothetical protein [Halobaculum saliterrae]MXR40558.1 hypothetical protein [Halobaculum saliterrae]